MCQIVLLIPCFNEEKTIKKVIEDFIDVLPRDLTSIYVYDNNSSDKTAIIANITLEEHNYRGGVIKEPRQGKGNVIRSMFMNIDADCYLLVDGDDTYSAKDSIKLCNEVINNQVDMAVGDRLSSTYFKVNKRPFHNIGNIIVRKIINTIWRKNKTNIFDVMTGYRAFSRKFVKSFPIVSKGFEIETEMTIHALDKNFIVKNIPISYKDRPEGSFSKLNTYKDGIRVIKTILKLFREYKPFEFFSYLSIFFFIVSALLGIPVLKNYFTFGLVPNFPSLIVSVGCFAISVQLLICGTILDVIVSKDRKNFELFLLNLMKH